jgi:hypothetical protein
VKAAGNEQPHGSKRQATADVKSYLADNTFCKVLKSQDHKYLVGIGSDGLRWTLWTKHLESGEVFEEVSKVDISSVVEGIGRRTGTIEGEAELAKPEERQLLCESLVSAFAARNLEDFVC